MSKNQSELTQQKLVKVVNALEKVNKDTNSMIISMAKSMSEIEIIRLFNQETQDLFHLLLSITKRLQKEDKYKVAGYKLLFDNAIKMNSKLPLDKFTLIILEFAPEIYAEDDNCFLNMSIPDSEVSVGNEFGVIRSEMFKNLWKELDGNDKKKIADNVIMLTTYAHAHFYKTVLLNTKK